MNEDELVSALLAKVGGEGAPESIVAQVEAQLGYALPPLLRRVYRDVGAGSFGPGNGLLHLDPGGEADHSLIDVHRQLTADPQWPSGLLPFCDWGCGIWSALDCRMPRGLVVTVSETGFLTQGHTLASWLIAWVEDIDLGAETMEPGETRPGINPFTKEPHAYSSARRPRGTRWP